MEHLVCDIAEKSGGGRFHVEGAARFSGRGGNCAQETDGSGVSFPAKIHSMRIIANAFRVWLSAAMLIFTVASRAPAQTAPPAPHTTVAIFADNPSHVESWDSVFATLRKNLPEATATAPSVDADPSLIRGDAIVPGMNVDAAIVVFLHGDCTLYPRTTAFPQGKALGWVYQQRGEIQPYIHVDCTRIAQALSVQSETMSREQRTAAMSEAISRVILHEWIHIASQRSGHRQNGLGKAQFTVEDLIPTATTRTIAHNFMFRVP